jgi:hypothetical protein
MALHDAYAFRHALMESEPVSPGKRIRPNIQVGQKLSAILGRVDIYLNYCP